MFKKRFVKFFVVAFVLLLICFICRNSFLQFAFKKVQHRALEKYHVELNATSIRFSGIDGIRVNELVIQPVGKDTLARVEEIFLNLSLFDLVTAKVGFDEVLLKRGLVTMYHKPERNNLVFLKSEEDRPDKRTLLAEVTYRDKADNLKSRLIRYFNTAFDLEDMQFVYEDSSAIEQVFVPAMKYDLEKFSGLLINQARHDTLWFNGKVVEKNKWYEFSVTHTNDSLVYLPFLDRDRKLKCRFKAVTVSLGFENAGDELEIITGIQAENFHLNHWRLANDDVVFEKAEFRGRINVREDVIELDSSSTIRLKDVRTRIFASYDVREDTIFTLHFSMPETVSDTFFHGLPQGMFNTLKGISCTGTLAYDLLFMINTRQPDSLVFNSSLTRQNFTIRHYGAESYERMNGSFTYPAYDKDRFVRNIEISPANPYFTPLNRISENLVHSVLQSEDPSFMLHRGFLPESFRESVVKNYKERRFARGGSTISMQLVKNVFLNRDKTISRKAEEALIVWLIENQHLVSKERMLEVYLNVIEWGPNVYGIGEASRFYFNKTPAELNLQESVFLAGIIPAPKYFKYQFDKEGKMKPYLSGYFRILTGRMASKGWISPADTIGLQPDVKLKGPALRMIVPADMPIPEEEE